MSRLARGAACAVACAIAACSSNLTLEERLAADPSLQAAESAAGPDPSVEPAPSEPPAPPEPELAPAERPSQLPAAIPVYPEAQLTGERGTRGRGQVTWRSRSGREPVLDFYRQALSGDGWELTAPVTATEEVAELRAQRGLVSVEVDIAPAADDTTRIAIAYERRTAGPAAERSRSATEPDPAPEENDSALPPPPTPVELSDLDAAPTALQGALRDLAQLGLLTPESGDRFAPNAAASRRVFARWLVAAHNALLAQPSAQIRLADPDTAGEPAFADVPPTDPGFPAIQGLAEAGILPSRLSGDATVTRFRPDAPLTRSALLSWKVPLDWRQGLPQASVEAVRDTWGFQDASQIDPDALPAVLADYSNGDAANIRRIFGFTRLLQPEKPATRAEAAAALWSFGSQGARVSAAELLARERQQASDLPTDSPQQREQRRQQN